MSNYVPGNRDGMLPSPSANPPTSVEPAWKQNRPIQRYSLIVLLVAAATLLLGLVIWPGYSAPTFALLYLVVLLSAWYGGLVPGLAATALSALAGAYFLMPPTFSMQLTSAAAMETGLFAGVAVLITVFGSARQRAELLLAEEISRQKERARALVEREEQYRRMADTAHQGIWMIDSQDRTSYVNRRGAEIMGYTPAEILGRSPLDFVYPEDRAELKELLARRREGLSETREFRVRCKDGRARWIFYGSAPVFDKQERYVGSLAMFNDITERKQAELGLHGARHAAEQLARRLARLQSVTAALSQALTPAQVAQVVLEEARQASETQAGIVYWLEQAEDGLWLETVRAEDYPAEVLEQFDRFPLTADLPAAEAARTGRPLWIGSYDQFLHRYPHLAVTPRPSQQQAFAIVPLQIERRILGVVVWSFDRPHEFEPDEQVFFLTLARQCGQALERARLYEAAQQARAEAESEVAIRRQTEEKLQISLQEKQTLLREVNHRVKNNLQAVSNLLSLQAYTITDPEVRAKFEETQDRIKSIALLHEKLYQTQDFTHLNFADYLADLAQSLIHSYKANPDLIRLKLECDEVPVKVDTAVSLGIIANELISNALKHAFVPEQAGELGVILRRDSDGHLRLEVWDNGKGLPAGFDLLAARSLGLQLVQTLAGYMKGRLTVEDGPGTRIRLVFPPLAEPANDPVEAR